MSPPAAMSPAAAKRTPLTRLDENIISKRVKRAHSPHTSIKAPPKLTEETLSVFDTLYHANATSFDGEKKARALQEAGKQMGFDLKLDCYEQATSSFQDWLRSQPAPFMERFIIFKDKEDIEALNRIAESFDVALAKASDIHCEA